MNKKIVITGIVCALLLMSAAYAADTSVPAAELAPAASVSDTAEAPAADTAAADAPAAAPVEEIPYSIGVKATVTGVNTTEDGYTSIEVKKEDGETIVLNLSDETIIVDNQAGTAVGLDSIKEGDTIYAYHSMMMTMSIPGQTPALAILTNLGETVPAKLHMPEQVRYLDNKVTALCDNGSIVLSTSDETVFTPYRTRQIVAAQDIRLGHAFLAWYDVVMESYPAQVTATRVMILPEQAEPDAVSLTLDGDMVIDAQWKDGTIVVPVRTTAEALGLTVGYRKEGDTAFVTIGNDIGEIRMTMGEDAYSYSTTKPGMVGATAALPYGAAPYLAPYMDGTTQVTWMSAEAFELLGYDVTLTHNQLSIKPQEPASTTPVVTQ